MKKIDSLFEQFMTEEYGVKFVDVTPDEIFAPGAKFDLVANSKALASDNRSRLMMFEKYIHTNECSDEGGWFAYFCPNGNATASFDRMKDLGLFVNGCDTEEEAVRVLIQTLISTILHE